jgi:hypothetical protein
MAVIRQDYSENVVGNNYAADKSSGFKNEVKGIFENYSSNGVNLFSTDLYNVITSPNARSEFIGELMEGFQGSPLTTNPEIANEPFYDNYQERLSQLIDNSFKDAAIESVLAGYSPIVSYLPFFIKKQWIENIMKDVVMTEVPKSPVINLAFERNYVRTLAGVEYALPDALYDDQKAAEIYSEATGLNFSEDPISLPLNKVNLIDPAYIPGVIPNDPSVELTMGLHVFEVTLSTTSISGAPTATVDVPVNAIVDVTTHNFIDGAVKYDVYSTANPPVKLGTLEDSLLGRLDTVNNTITLHSESGIITKVKLRGKIANRFNERSIDVTRRVEHIEKTMPESGPRINTSVTVEDCADALATQNIDVVAYNIDLMGQTLGAFEDSEILSYLRASFDKVSKLQHMPFDYDVKFTVQGEFDALPYEGYTGNISKWMVDGREYFDRVLSALKPILKSPDLIVVAVAHPNVLRYIIGNGPTSWVFSNDTQISGMKLSYNFGIYNSGNDRVHLLTSLRLSEDEGIRLVVLPLTSELITHKHYKYNTVIDRNYRNPLHSLTPNIMATMRTLTFDVLPVQGLITIKGRSLISPETLVR